MYNHIVPECYVDTMLVQSLLGLKGQVCIHKHGCFNVARELEIGRLKDDFGVGVIDNDKHTVTYLNVFSVVDVIYYESNRKKESLILWKHNNSKVHHYFIQICPAVERWITLVCEESIINLKNFGLPDTLDEMKKITKAQTSIYDDRFVKLFKAMKECENVSVKKLQNWLNILVKDNYNVDINELKNG